MVDIVSSQDTGPAMKAYIEQVRWGNGPNRVETLRAIARSRTEPHLRALAEKYADAVADEEQAVRDFPWPCAIRTAHEAHHPSRLTLTQAQIDMHGGDCPGVKAYPLTMIGKAHRG